jgi:hypothetical protein
VLIDLEAEREICENGKKCEEQEDLDRTTDQVEHFGNLAGMADVGPVLEVHEMQLPVEKAKMLSSLQSFEYSDVKCPASTGSSCAFQQGRCVFCGQTEAVQIEPPADNKDAVTAKTSFVVQQLRRKHFTCVEAKSYIFLPLPFYRNGGGRHINLYVFLSGANRRNSLTYTRSGTR